MISCWTFVAGNKQAEGKLVTRLEMQLKEEHSIQPKLYTGSNPRNTNQYAKLSVGKDRRGGNSSRKNTDLVIC